MRPVAYIPKLETVAFREKVICFADEDDWLQMLMEPTKDMILFSPDTALDVRRVTFEANAIRKKQMIVAPVRLWESKSLDWEACYEFMMNKYKFFKPTPAGNARKIIRAILEQEDVRNYDENLTKLLISEYMRGTILKSEYPLVIENGVQLDIKSAYLHGLMQPLPMGRLYPFTAKTLRIGVNWGALVKCIIDDKYGLIQSEGKWEPGTKEYRGTLTELSAYVEREYIEIKSQIQGWKYKLKKRDAISVFEENWGNNEKFKKVIYQQGWSTYTTGHYVGLPSFHVEHMDIAQAIPDRTYNVLWWHVNPEFWEMNRPETAAEIVAHTRVTINTARAELMKRGIKHGNIIVDSIIVPTEATQYLDVRDEIGKLRLTGKTGKFKMGKLPVMYELFGEKRIVKGGRLWTEIL